jgi:hypothetical protein
LHDKGEEIHQKQETPSDDRRVRFRQEEFEEGRYQTDGVHDQQTSGGVQFRQDVKDEYGNAETMQSFDEEYLLVVRKKINERQQKSDEHTTVNIFTVGHGLLPNKHLPKLSTNVKAYGAHTEISNIQTQRS